MADNFQFKTQREKIDVRKFETSTVIGRNGALFPGNLRLIICGSSGSGKTSIAVSLILHENGLRFLNFYLFSPSYEQEKFKVLLTVLRSVKGLNVHVSPRIEAVEIKPESLILFDDVLLESSELIEKYFSYGRHKNIDTILIGQSYGKIRKHMIRDNCNVIILLKQDRLNLKLVYEGHVNGDMKFSEFEALARKCWEKDFGFLLIDKTRQLYKGKYRRGFNDFLVQNGKNQFEKGNSVGNTGRKKKVSAAEKRSS